MDNSKSGSSIKTQDLLTDSSSADSDIVCTNEMTAPEILTLAWISDLPSTEQMSKYLLKKSRHLDYYERKQKKALRKESSYTSKTKRNYSSRSSSSGEEFWEEICPPNLTKNCSGDNQTTKHK